MLKLQQINEVSDHISPLFFHPQLSVVTIIYPLFLQIYPHLGFYLALINSWSFSSEDTKEISWTTQKQLLWHVFTETR